MTRDGALILVTGLLLAAAAAPAWAHHGFAGGIRSDQAAQAPKRTVTKWEVTNPHSWIHIDVKGDDGKVVPWMIEGGSPNNLYRLSA